jgi:hypothetical protein
VPPGDAEVLDDDVALGRAAENDPFGANGNDMLAAVLEKCQLEHYLSGLVQARATMVSSLLRVVTP